MLLALKYQVGYVVHCEYERKKNSMMQTAELIVRCRQQNLAIIWLIKKQYMYFWIYWLHIAINWIK